MSSRQAESDSKRIFLRVNSHGIKAIVVNRIGCAGVGKAVGKFSINMGKNRGHDGVSQNGWSVPCIERRDKNRRRKDSAGDILAVVERIGRH